MKIYCLYCSQEYIIDEEFIGCEAVCEACNNTFLIKHDYIGNQRVKKLFYDSFFSEKGLTEEPEKYNLSVWVLRIAASLVVILGFSGFAKVIMSMIFYLIYFY